MKMKTAIVCGTPYQIFNAINIVNSGSADEIYDFYVFNRFENAKEISERLKIVPSISKTFLMKDYQKDIVKGKRLTGVIKNIHSAYIYMRPHKSIASYFNSEEECNYVSENNQYNRILAPTPSFFLQCLEKINQKAILDYYEDGIGSYAGNFNKDSASFERKLFSKIFKVGYNVIPVRYLYVYKPEMCSSTVSKEIKALSVVDSTLLSIEKNVFDLNGDFEKMQVDVLWFSEGIKQEKDFEILDYLKSNSMKVGIRLHPKNKDVQSYKQLRMPMDDTQRMWEVRISDADISNVLLVGGYSTAMVTPKLLYNIEPRIIFTYKLYNLNDTVVLNKVEFFIDQTKSIYSNPNKIFVPETMDQFKEYINNLI